MSLVVLALAIVKILIVLMFVLNMAAIATWMDRRQSAMVQDRVGPNRAVIWLPSLVVKGIVAGPPAGLAAALLAGLAYAKTQESFPLRQPLEWAFWLGNIAIFLGWMTLLVARSHARGQSSSNPITLLTPKLIVYGGFALQIAFSLLTATLEKGTQGQKVFFGTGAALAGVLLAGALLGFVMVPSGRVGVRLAGLLHAGADAIKLFLKEDFIPPGGDKLLHSLAPIVSMLPALIVFAVIPFGQPLCFKDHPDGVAGVLDFMDLSRLASTSPGVEFVCKGHSVPLQISDLNVGILFLFAVAGTSVVGAAIAGWASDNKYSLMGGLRAASQMVSYEVAMGLSLVGLFMTTGSLRLGDIVEWQRDNAWGVFVQPIGFVLFLTALAAEGKRCPFDQPEGESEIVAGPMVEYSGMKFGMFFTGEYAELIVSSMLVATLFFGGYTLPFLAPEGLAIVVGGKEFFSFGMTHGSVVALSVVTFFAKTIVVAWIQIFFRWTLPRFRYDQLMALGWTKLLPIGLVNVVLTAVALIALDSAGPGFVRTMATVGELTHAAIVLAGFAGFIAFVNLLLSPARRFRFTGSSSAHFAEQTGGVKPTVQQA